MIRFVLVKTSHPGNIGASARAMKNMGFFDLWLVSPSCFPHPEALARSSGAQDVLEQAHVVASLQDAIADCTLVFGTSSRSRELAIPLVSTTQIASYSKNAYERGDNIAIVFGGERTGLTNIELSYCHYHLYIPCNSNYPSLNLAAAVQIVAYELHRLAEARETMINQDKDSVTANQMENFYEHLEKTLIALGFLDVSYPKHMMRKLRRLFNRTSIEHNEMNILRGILTAINKIL